MDAQSSVKSFNNAVFGIVRNMTKPNPVKGTADLRKLIPEADMIIQVFKKRVDTLQTESPAEKGFNLTDRFNSFKNTRVDSLNKLYTRTFSQLIESSRITIENLQNLQNELSNAEANSKSQLESLLSGQNMKFKSILASKRLEHERLVENLTGRISAANNSANEKVKAETQRISDHFEKQLQSKTDALQMTKNASEKAEAELKEITEKRNKELQEIQKANNEILKKHKEKVESQLQEEESFVSKLKDHFDNLHRSHLNMGPEIERQWQEIKKRHEASFENIDKLFQIELEEKMRQIPILKENIQKIDSENQLHQEEHSIELEKTRNILSNKVKESEERQSKDIEEAKEKIRNQLESRMKRMNEALEQLQSKIESDRLEFIQKADEKAARHQERVQNIMMQQQKEIEDKKAEIEATIEAEKQTKLEWKERRKQINQNYESDMKDVSMKLEADTKYFEHKMAMLRAMLGSIQEENNQIEVEADEEIAKIKSEVDEDERAYSARVKQEMNEEIQRRVSERMKEVRDKHRAEIAEIAGEEIHKSASTADIQRAAEVSQNNVVTSSFASEEFVGAQAEKHRNNFVNETKNLRQEEASALRNLESVRQSYAETVERTKSLQKQLEEANASFEHTLESLSNEKDQDIEKLKHEVEEKEKAIAILDREFSENEKEVRRRFRQISAAEERISELTAKLNAEKEKIRNIIRKEYQPIILAEEQKATAISSDLEKLRNEMELSIEYLRSDLLGVETSNAAMEEDLRKETDQLVAKLRNDLIDDIADAEEASITEMNKEEMDHLDAMNHQKDFIFNDTQDKIAVIEEKLEKEKEHFTQEIAIVNDKCLAILSANSDKKDKIHELQNTECAKCPVLEKNIKKLEKLIVRLQYDDRSLVLDDKNKNELYHMFKGKAKLPPLPTKIE